VGLLGPDEPRYASIGRAMARTGDYVTPRLDGAPWFEKPPLLYWLVAAGHKAGLGDDLAPRVPLVLFSCAYLVLQFFALWRLLGGRIAWIATLILPATAGWAAYSQIGVTDLPLAVTFTSTVWLGLLAWRGGQPKYFAAAGVCFGLALLAKGLVPGVLILPLLVALWRRWKGLLLAGALALVVAGPWYGAMLARHGQLFFDDFIVKHHFSRFSSTALQHVQPWWFYLPVLLAGLFPWVAALGEGCKRWWTEPVQRMILVVFLFGLAFFSLSTNKLPGYILPLVPLAVTLVACGLAEAREAGWGLSLAAALLGLCPVIAGLLPEALLLGLRHATLREINWAWFAVSVPVSAAVWILESKQRRVAACAVVSLATLGGLMGVKESVAPALDNLVSARGLARRVHVREADTCVDSLHRSLRYGLNYYTAAPLPDCGDEARRFAIRQKPRALPRVEPR